MYEEQYFRDQLKTYQEQEKRAREVLGLDSDCSHSEIIKAFRKLAKLHHPDKNPDSRNFDEKFRLELNAYLFLTGKTNTLETTSVEAKRADMKLGEYADNEWGHYCWYVDNFMADFIGFGSG